MTALNMPETGYCRLCSQPIQRRVQGPMTWHVLTPGGVPLFLCPDRSEDEIADGQGGHLLNPDPVRRCKWCRNVIVQREMFVPGATNMNGAVEPAVSIGQFWIGPKGPGGGDSTICEQVQRPGADDHHEPMPQVPDMADRAALSAWLDA